MSLLRPPPGNRPEPRNRLTRDIETRLNLTPTQKIEILEKLAELQKKEKLEAPDRVDHPLQITKVLGDFFGDQIRYYEFTSSNKKTEGSNWSRKELLDRRKCFLIDNFHEFYKGEKVLFDQHGQLLEFLMTHYEHCEGRFGGILLSRAMFGNFSAMILLKAKNKKVWTHPKGCRNLYTFKDNRKTFDIEIMPPTLRLVPASDPEGDIQVALREIRKRTGFREDAVKKLVQGYVTLENGLYDMKFFVFILSRMAMKPKNWDADKTDDCQWIEWNFPRINWERIKGTKEVQLFPFQDTISMDEMSVALHKTFYFLKNLDKVIWATEPPREAADLYVSLRYKEDEERRQAELQLPPLPPFNSVLFTPPKFSRWTGSKYPLYNHTNRKTRLDNFVFMQSLDPSDHLKELGLEDGPYLVSSQLSGALSDITHPKSVDCKENLQPEKQNSKYAVATSQTELHAKPSHLHQPSQIGSKTELPGWQRGGRERRGPWVPKAEVKEEIHVLEGWEEGGKKSTTEVEMVTHKPLKRPMFPPLPPFQIPHVKKSKH